MNKNLFRLMVILALGAVLCLPGVAMALTENWASWDFTTDPTPNQVDTLLLFIELPSTATFAGTGFNMLPANTGWSNSLKNSQYAYASGPATNYLNAFSTNFTGTVPAGTYVDWYAYSGGINGTLVEEYRQTVGDQYSFVAITTPRDDPSHNLVPLPPSVLLLGSGLLGLGLLRLRRKTEA